MLIRTAGLLLSCLPGADQAEREFAATGALALLQMMNLVTVLMLLQWAGVSSLPDDDTVVLVVLGSLPVFWLLGRWIVRRAARGPRSAAFPSGLFYPLGSIIALLVAGVLIWGSTSA